MRMRRGRVDDEDGCARELHALKRSYKDRWEEESSEKRGWRCVLLTLPNVAVMPAGTSVLVLSYQGSFDAVPPTHDS